LLNNIFSPVLKEETRMSGTGFLAVAAREAAANATAAANAATRNEIEKANNEILHAKTLSVMYGWHTGMPLNLITKTVDLPPKKIKELMVAFDKIKVYCLSKKQIDIAELQKLSGLTEACLKALLTILKRKV
jgi:hypothetical protein